MRTLLLLKTDAKHLLGVKKHSKHATEAIPKDVTPGDLLLIQVTALTSRTRAPMVEYAMTFVRCYEDRENESDAIWGRHWQYIIEGSDFYKLRKPFNVRRMLPNTLNVNAAVKYAYINPTDAAELERRGSLEPTSQD